MSLVQMKLVLILVVLSLSTFHVHGAIPELIDDRTPKDKCKDWKLPKSTKSSKSSKSPKGTETPGIRRLSEEEVFEDEVRQLSKKSSKSPKGSKAPKSETCYCPCCNEDSCKDLMDAVEFNPDEGINDGTGKFCLVGGPTHLFDIDEKMSLSEIGFEDVCFYDEDGNLDFDGKDNLGDCCEKLEQEHSWGCDEKQERSRQLNEASASNERTVTTHEDGVTVEVKAAEPSSLDWIHAHVIEMKDRMERGDVAREWDPLFQAYFDNSHHIDMNCNAGSADSLSCKYSSKSQCGIDLIHAHAGYHKEIADSIRSGGSHKITDTHAMPDSCQ